MIRLVFLSALFIYSNAFAGDVLYCACVGDDPQYQLAALQQVVKNDSGNITSTFTLDLASAADEYMTRYSQKGEIIFSSEPLNEEDSVVVGSFEKDENEVGLSIYYFWKTGYRVEISVDGRIVKMPCKKKL